ncbi:MAG: DUF790 family protein [Deltaproteobacteria bacterium]|nr:DUF790 family protein [Deltaproteobacteria bacterium]
MLTADHVEARIKDGALVLRKLDAKARADAERLASAFLEDARAHVGFTREELETAWSAHDAGARAKLAAGLRKLALDRCVFDEETTVDPVALRRDLFRRACTSRRTHGSLDRARVIAETAEALGVDAERVEKALFADRRGENVLRTAPNLSPRALVDAYEMGRTQAVLLKAARVVCDVGSTSPALVRAFFAKLKFHQLLFTIERRDASTLRVTIDGPFSMFDAVTRYGLKLALVVPALRELDTWTLEADIRWGKARTPVVFKDQQTRAAGGEALVDAMPDDLRALVAAIEADARGFRADVAAEVLATARGEVVVPDLVLTRGEQRVYVELLGFWSRDAVWRRVELAERGLGAPVVFCVNERLRVSEQVLGDDAHEGSSKTGTKPSAALYVYKTRPVARALLDRVERLT